MKLYRLFLPQSYNEGGKIPKKEILGVTQKIREKFGALSVNPFATLPIIQGTWTSATKKQFEEPMFLIEIFLEDTFDNAKWIKSFKEIIRQELKQEEIFLISQDAELC